MGKVKFQNNTLNVKEPPNKACSGFLGVCAIYEHFSGFEFFLLSGIFPARPKSANANRWLANSVLQISYEAK